MKHKLEVDDQVRLHTIHAFMNLSIMELSVECTYHVVCHIYNAGVLDFQLLSYYSILDIGIATFVSYSAYSLSE